MIADDALHERPAELLQRLIRFDTTNPPGAERPCVEWVASLLRAAGVEPKIVARDPERPSLVARLHGTGSAPGLLMQGHIDVVPAEGQWSYPPFSGEIADGYLWGRGALDMKGGVAMMLAAFLRAVTAAEQPAGDVVLCLLSDEEAGSDFGARFVVEEHPELFDGVKYAIGEFGGFSLEIAGRRFYPMTVSEKQLCLVRATLRGRADLVAENVLLRHQLTVLTRPGRKRPPLRARDQRLWVLARRFGPDWRRRLALVRPDTVVRWHRRAGRLIWWSRATAPWAAPGSAPSCGN